MKYMLDIALRPVLSENIVSK